MKKDKDKLRLYRPSGVEVGQELTIKNAAKHCLYLELERYRIDGRSALGHEIAKSRDALVALFPDGKPDAAANVLINMIVYKTLKLEIFQAWDYATGGASATGVAHYLNLSNSLRKDLTTLLAMVDRVPTHQVPDLQEYLAGLEKVNEEKD
jgi:hypothetical protein